MHNYIELARTFSMPDDGKGSYDSYWESMDLWGKKSWDDLLKLPRVVIHARAGLGKSYEMEHIASKLFQQGRNAFYIRLEDLKSDRLTEYFLGEEAERFNHWLTSESETAWLFLDSVDELKLTHAKLEQALRNVAKDIPCSKLSDIHIYLSSRPSDWSNQVDQPALERLLPCKKKVTDDELIPCGEDLYLKVLSSDWQGEPIKQGLEDEPVLYYELNALTKDQVKTYVESKMPDQASTFLTALSEQHAWDFAGCPLDLDGLLVSWKKHSRLGHRLQQYSDGSRERLSKNTQGRTEQRILSTEKLLIGAEKLALAMVLTRCSYLLSPESGGEPAPEALPAHDVLSDWSESEVKELLRSALFDPATHGCVQFHHRSMREYLAAKCLTDLQQQGLPFLSLKSTLFKLNYGEQVIPHYLKPVVAWLAAIDERFFDLAVDYFPELLMSDGAPDAYRIDQRKRLVASFAAKYAVTERVLNIPSEFVVRLAHPELADTLRALWAEHSEYPDFRELALGVIEAGRIKACADMAFAVTQDRSLPSTHITQAIYALDSCGAHTELNRLAQQVVETSDQFSNRVIINTLSVLFPRYISSDQLMGLVNVIGVSKRDSNARINLMFEFDGLANTIEPLDKTGREFRAALSQFLFDSLDKNSCSWNPSSPYDYLTNALKIICYKQLARDERVDDAFLLDCVLINKLHEERHSSKYLKVDGVPANSIQLDLSAYRKEAFRAELLFAKSFKERDDAWSVFSDLRHSNSLIYPFNTEDWGWLVELLESDLGLFEQQVSIWMLYSVWLERGEREQEKEVLKAYAIQADLEDEMPFLFKPIKEDPREKKWKKEDEARAKEIAEHEGKRQECNIAWRFELLAQLNLELEKETNVIRLYDWISVYKNDYSRIAWDKAAVANAFSPELADAAELAFRQKWREHHHSFWSERDKDSYFNISDQTRLALNGLYIESQRAHWSSHLTVSQVETAIRLMLIELESFKPALTDLYRSYPKHVSSLIAKEAIAQLGWIFERADLPLVNELYQLPDSMVVDISAEILLWLADFIHQSGKVYTNDKVQDIFRFVSRSTEGEQIDKAVTLCCQWLDKCSLESLEITLFESLLLLDNQKALKAIISRLKALQLSEQDHAVRLLGRLFGHHGFEFKRHGLPDLVNELMALVRLSYQFIVPSEDITHNGMYTPSYRDNAQTARSFLLSSVVSTSGSEAYKALLDLSEKTEFKHIQQRLKLWANNRAAADTEEKAFTLQDVKASFTAKAFVPYDRDSLFDVVLSKLDEVEHYLKNDDYSNIADWREKKDEEPVQQLLSDRLKVLSQWGTQKLFSIEKEPEVFGKKKPDLRITSLNGHDRAVIELKYGNKSYTVPGFEQILEKQLIEKYLRHDSCRAGILFISLHKSRTWRPEKGKTMTFSELINHLNSKAIELEKKYNHELRLGVFGLDLTEI